MAKNQTRDATNASSNLLNEAPGIITPIVGGLQTTAAAATGNQTDERNAAYQGIGAAQSTGGYDATQLANLENETQNIANTGGFTGAQTQTLNRGGYDPTTLNNIMGGYSSFANTGGFTPTQANQFIEQATQGTDNTYAGLEEQAKLASIRTGGLNPTAGISQMARQLGQAQSQNTLNAEVALNQQVNANKFSGLAGESGVESNVAANKMAGAGMVQSGKVAGVNQQLGLQSGVASGKTTANSQMSSLFDESTGQITALGQQILSALGLNFGTQSEAIGALTSLSKNPGAFQTALGDIAGLGGAAAGAAGALGVHV